MPRKKDSEDIKKLKRFVKEMEEFRHSSGLQEILEEANEAMRLVREIYYGENGIFHKEEKRSFFYDERTTISYPSL